MLDGLIRTRQPAVVLVSNTLWYLHTFRRRTIEALLARGIAVACLGQDGPEAAKLRDMGCAVTPLRWRLDSLNPIHELGVVAQILRVIMRVRPAIVFSFTIKANLNTSVACRLCAIPYATNVSGLGTAFLREGLIFRLIRVLFGFANAGAHTTFFQNADDRDLFTARGLSLGRRTLIIPGSGVDTRHFAYAPPRTRIRTFLMVARLIRDKGVVEYLEAAKHLKALDPSLRFILVGPLGIQNVSALSRDELGAYRDVVDYRGELGDIRAVMAQSDCIVLPSYREGMPKVVLEAASIGRISIVADVPGCRHAIIPGRTGLLCEPRSTESLVSAMQRACKLDEAEVARMSRAARAHAEQEFSDERCITPYLAIVDDLTSPEAAMRGAGVAIGIAAALGVLVLKLANVLITFASIIVLTRWLGAAEYGLFALALASLAIANVPLGVAGANVLMREAARGPAGLRRLGGFVAAAKRAALGLGVVALLAAALLVGEAHGVSAFAAFCIGGIVWMDSLSGVRSGILRGFGAPLYAQAADQLLKPLIFLVMVLALSVLSRAEASLDAALAAPLIASAAACLGGWMMLRRKVPDAALEGGARDWTWLAPAFQISVSTGLLTIGLYAETYILALLTDPASVGVYRVAFQLSLIAGMAYASINLVASPLFGALTAKHDIASLATASRNFARAALLLTIPLPLLLWLYGEALLAVIFGPEFRAAYSAMAILLLGHLINAFAGLGASLLLMLKLERWIILGAGLGLAATILSSVLLIPHFNLFGAAMSSVAGVIVSNLTFVSVVVSRCGFDPTALGLRPRAGRSAWKSGNVL